MFGSLTLSLFSHQQARALCLDLFYLTFNSIAIHQRFIHLCSTFRPPRHRRERWLAVRASNPPRTADRRQTTLQHGLLTRCGRCAVNSRPGKGYKATGLKIATKQLFNSWSWKQLPRFHRIKRNTQRFFFPFSAFVWKKATERMDWRGTDLLSRHHYHFILTEMFAKEEERQLFFSFCVKKAMCSDVFGALTALIALGFCERGRSGFRGRKQHKVHVPKTFILLTLSSQQKQPCESSATQRMIEVNDKDLSCEVLPLSVRRSK